MLSAISAWCRGCYFIQPFTSVGCFFDSRHDPPDLAGQAICRLGVSGIASPGSEKGAFMMIFRIAIRFSSFGLSHSNCVTLRGVMTRYNTGGRFAIVCCHLWPSGNLIQLLPFTEFEGSASWLEPGISDLVVGSSDSLYSEILVRRHSLYADLRATIIEHDSGYKQPWTQAYVDISNVLDSVVQGAWQGKESGIRSADQIQYGLTPYRQTVPQANLLVQFADTIEASLRVESFSQIGSVASEWSALQRELVALPSSGRVAGQIALFQVCATSLPADPDPTPITLGQTALRLFEIEDALVTAGGDSPERLGSTALHLVFRHWP